MEEKKYVYYVSTGVVGVDDRKAVGRFSKLADAITAVAHHQILLSNKAKIESQQVQYRNTNEFTQFDVQIEKASFDEDGYFVESDIIVYEKTPKFRYGQEVK